MAGWSEPGGGIRLEPGRYVAQIVAWANVPGKAFRPGEEAHPQFEWTLNVWDGAAWLERKIWTKQRFARPDPAADPQFVPQLMKLVVACGLPLPTCREEAADWSPDVLVGRRFGLVVQENPENPEKVTLFYVTEKKVTQQEPVRVTPAAAPPPEAAPVDPFEGDAGGVPASAPARPARKAGAARPTPQAGGWQD